MTAGENNREISAQAAALLKYYVYVYSHPQTGKPFYIGKGKGGRMFSHLDSPDGEKGDVIHSIRKSGMEPHIDILRYGLSESEALLVEAAAIDLIGKGNLANLVSGVTRGYGRISAREFLATMEAKPVDVKHVAILFKVSRLYRADMTARELYDITRSSWKLGGRREKAEYAIALYQGVAKEVYRIHSWHPAEVLPDDNRDVSSWKYKGRWVFEGAVAEDAVRDLYVGNKMRIPSKKINVQTPTLYANI